ncbi:MAG TPA: hypothetical protein VLL52_25395 [Anaerolineae bacterium]|nr:hypothetical protein [Anaerolineae bacterium]
MGELSYRVSVVIKNSNGAGALIRTADKPAIGDKIDYSGKLYKITELVEILPAQIGAFGILHATCEPFGQTGPLSLG